MESLLSAFKNKKNVITLKKKEYDIYYDCKLKYPLMTVSKITDKTGTTTSVNKIRRKDIEDPFKQDKKLDKKCSMTSKEYSTYMEYGGSLGHNQPAGHHKTNLSTYNETFLFSNISPQEIVFNTGLWIILETWTKRLQDDSNLEDIRVFTGNVPSKKTMDFNGVKMNVPDYMYKLVSCKHKKHPDKFYIACFLMKNEPPTKKIHKIYNYLVGLKELSEICNIDFFKFFNYYSQFNQKKYKISSMNKIVRVDVKFNGMLAKQMISSLYYGKLIYSETIDILEKNWSDAKRSGFGDEFHEVYYDLAKKRIIRENKSLSLTKKTSKKGKKSEKGSRKSSTRKESRKSSGKKKGKTKFKSSR
jgi:DNA/RNA endonuclease G (NUC1)